MTILAYDEENLKILESCLKEIYGRKLRFYGFTNVLDVVSAAEWYEYDVCFSDLSHDNNDGMVLLGMLNDKFPKHNFIGAVTKISYIDSLVLTELSISYYFYKPYQVDKITKALKELGFSVEEEKGRRNSFLDFINRKN